MRLAVPAGSTVRFDPGEPATVALVPIGGGAGRRSASPGWSTGRWTRPARKEAALRRARACGYLGTRAGARTAVP